MTKPSSDQLSGLRRALARHLPLLRQATTHPNRFGTDLHNLVAGQLRALLCDQEIPILVEYAGALEIPLYIWVTVDPVSTERADVRLQLSGLLASWDPMPLTTRVLLTTYLHSKLHVVGYRTLFTPCQLINQAANKHDLDPLAISFVDSLHAVIDAVPGMQRAPVERLRFLYEQLLDDIAACVMMRWRRKRAYPRVVKVKVSNFLLKRPSHKQELHDFETETKILGQVRISA